ncbi:MAG: MBL fold metallo-hydrolase [Nitrospirae bacterium]|nr:MBL fold metallo-hydrolase [Nitrospirota bacterium]
MSTSNGLYSRDAFAGLPTASVWVGHSTFLFKIRDKIFITDPVFSKRVTILPRLKPPAISIDQIPQLDYILVSHTHFDHLDRPSLKTLASAFPLARPIFPARAQSYVRDVAMGRSLFLEVGESYSLDGLRITRVPAQHFGGRYGFDQLWKPTYGGLIAEYGGTAVYFAGDTGYCRAMFEEIGARAKLDLALLPIGAYSPPPIRHHHMNPEDAVNAMTDLGARAMIPMHHSTFILSAEPTKEPITRLRSLAARRPELKIHFPRFGEILPVP